MPIKERPIGAAEPAPEQPEPGPPRLIKTGRETMQERVQKILAASGVASRRKAEEYIRQGRVTVNGTVIALGTAADPEADRIELDGVPIGKPEKPVYILLHKPRGYVTTMQDEKGRKSVSELVDCGTRVYPVGRLDMDSEGLLLMTNDGALTNILLHPGHEIDKIYHVWVKNYRKDRGQSMARPMDIDGYRIRPAGVEVLWQQGDTALLQVTIHEGRNRQIRKMAAACQMAVTRLRRVAEGPLQLGDLPRGQWRYLSENEILSLQKMKMH